MANLSAQFIDAMDKANLFYATSFSNLIIITFGVVTFVGVVLPIVISILQNRQLKSENETLRRALEQHATTLSQQQFDELQKKLDEREKAAESRIDAKLGEMKARIDRLNSESAGSIFHLQGNAALEAKNIEVCAESFSVAANHYLAAENYADMRTLATALHSRCLPKLSEENFSDQSSILPALEKFLKALEKKNHNGSFTDLLKQLNKELSLAKKRKNAAPPNTKAE